LDFRLSEEQQALYDTVAAFAREHVEPGAADRDKNAWFDWDVWRKLNDVGLLGLPVPEEYGGSGADCLTTGLALEALQYGGSDAGLNLSLGAHLTIGCMPLVLHGTEAQKQQWLPKLTSGETIGAFAITEPEAGSDTAGMKTNARLEGDTWVLNGSKTFITNGNLADVVTVIARTDPDAPAGAAFSAFLVEAGIPGFSVSREIPKLGCKSSPTCELSFTDVEVPADAMLGEPGTALWKVGFECFSWERTVMIASGIGGMRRGIERSVAYAKQREAFGKPIAKFGQIQHKLADMRIKLEAATLLQRQAAWKKDQGLDHQLEASMAKAYLGDVSVQNALDAIQIHGGWGYTAEFHVERGLRDSKLASLGGGTTEIQEMIIARTLLGG
jgi:alkylation response protein AidB-like acyl-CoA dehydrogenase